jgi:putative transposase
MVRHPFEIGAIVILPDHMHAIWTLPPEDDDYSTRWRLIKGNFSRHHSVLTEEIPRSMYEKKEKAIWQRRFWEHNIRDQEDYNRHCDYIQYNPVKHGLAASPADWKHSRFSAFVRRGLYDPNRGSDIRKELVEMSLE